MISTPDLKNLVARFRRGDKSVRDDIIAGHINLAKYLAGRSRASYQDAVGVALMELVESVDKAGDVLEDDNIQYYLTAKIKRRLAKHAVEDRLIRVPPESRRRKKLALHNKVEAYEYVDGHEEVSLEFKEAAKRSASCVKDVVILDLKMQGYTIEEIAAKMGLSKSKVHRDLEGIKERFAKYYEV